MDISGLYKEEVGGVISKQGKKGKEEVCTGGGRCKIVIGVKRRREMEL